MVLFKAADNEAEFSDYLSAQIFRSDLERWISEPHFEYSVLRCFVRFHGNEAKIEKSRNEYSMMEVIDCQNKEDVQPYKQVYHSLLFSFQLDLATLIKRQRFNYCSKREALNFGPTWMYFPIHLLQ